MSYWPTPRTTIVTRSVAFPRHPWRWRSSLLRRGATSPPPSSSPCRCPTTQARQQSLQGRSSTSGAALAMRPRGSSSRPSARRSSSVGSCGSLARANASSRGSTAPRARRSPRTGYAAPSSAGRPAHKRKPPRSELRRGFLRNSTRRRRVDWSPAEDSNLSPTTIRFFSMCPTGKASAPGTTADTGRWLSSYHRRPEMFGAEPGCLSSNSARRGKECTTRSRECPVVGLTERPRSPPRGTPSQSDASPRGCVRQDCRSSSPQACRHTSPAPTSWRCPSTWRPRACGRTARRLA